MAPYIAATYVVQVLGCGLFILGLVICVQAGGPEPATVPAAPRPVVVRHRCRGCGHAVEDHDPVTGRCTWVDCRCARNVVLPEPTGDGAVARGGEDQ